MAFLLREAIMAIRMSVYADIVNAKPREMRSFCMIFSDGRIYNIKVQKNDTINFPLSELHKIYKINKCPSLEVPKKVHKDDKYYDFDGKELNL